MNRDVWMDDVFRPLAVGGMMGCIALSLVHLIQLFFPSWSGTFMVVGCVLAALEANYSYRLVRSRRLQGSELIRFRVVEIALFLIVLRIGSYVGDPWSEVMADILSWPQDPGRALDFEVMCAVCLAVLSWSVSTRTTSDLERIGEPPVRDRYYVPPVDALLSRFFWGGAMLLFTAGITRIGIANLLNLTRPSVPGLIVNVLIYFVLGLLMLGQIQLSRLSEGWRKEGLELPDRLAGHWARCTLILLGLAGLVAFLLPTAYTLPLLDIAAIVIQTILYIFNVIFYLVVLVFLLLLAPLARLLGGEISSEPQGPISPPEIQRVTPGGATPAWFDVVKSLAFWGFALGLIVYVVRTYLRDRPDLVRSLKELKLLPGLGCLLRSLGHQLADLFGEARERIPQQLRLLQGWRERERPGGQEPFRFFRLGALSRRERTIYYYLSILRRAARSGYPRNQSQTPYEYERDLGPNVPQAEAELDRLTDAFVEVRYSTHEVHDEQEARVRADWRKIRAALRSLRRRTTSEKSASG